MPHYFMPSWLGILGWKALVNMNYGLGLADKARFSKREFCLVTSLKYDCLSNVINKEYEAIDGGIHGIYF